MPRSGSFMEPSWPSSRIPPVLPDGPVDKSSWRPPTGAIISPVAHQGLKERPWVQGGLW